MATTKATKTATKKAPKSKIAVKAKAPPKSSVKIKMNAKAKVKAGAKTKAKVQAKPMALVKPHIKAAASKVHGQSSAGPTPRESIFARLLREKAERHEALQKQKEHGHQANDQRMPQNHASYSKFAGPRRRAS